MNRRLPACLLLIAALVVPAALAHAADPLICVDHEGVYVGDITYDPPEVCLL